MKINWKMAFWSVLAVGLATILLLSYLLASELLKSAFFSDHYEDMKSDLEQLSKAMPGNLEVEDFSPILKGRPDYQLGEPLELNTLKITFDTSGRVDAIVYKWDNPN
ncbi:MAG: hypothetical protein ACK4Q5_11370 [Saprospiraceae bacterium]